MNTCQIADAVVTANEQYGATERGFDCDDQIEAINDHLFVLDFFKGNAMLNTTVQTLVRTSGARDGLALACAKTMTIAYELQRGSQCVLSG